MRFILNSLRKNKGWDFSWHLKDRAFDWGYDPDEVDIALVDELPREIKILHYPYRKDKMDIVAYTYPALKEGFSNWSSEIRGIFEVENPDERIVKDWQAAGCPDTPSELKEWVYQRVEELPRESLNQLVSLATKLVCETARLMGDIALSEDLARKVFSGDPFPLRELRENRLERETEETGEILRVLFYDALLAVEEDNEDFWETVAYIPKD